MGSERTTVVQDKTQTQTTTPEATPEETRLNQLALERAESAQEGLIGSQTKGLDLIQLLLSGQNLPGQLGPLGQGISTEAIGTQASRLARQNLAGFQNVGLADSGVAFRETAKDISEGLLFPAEQFNIGSLQNLLNLALSGQAQVQQPILGSEGQVGARLAGLRPITSVGQSSGQTQQFAPNPFLSSFQRSLGQTLGSPTFAAGPFGF